MLTISENMLKRRRELVSILSGMRQNEDKYLDYKEEFYKLNKKIKETILLARIANKKINRRNPLFKMFEIVKDKKGHMFYVEAIRIGINQYEYYASGENICRWYGEKDLTKHVI